MAQRPPPRLALSLAPLLLLLAVSARGADVLVLAPHAGARAAHTQLLGGLARLDLQGDETADVATAAQQLLADGRPQYAHVVLLLNGALPGLTLSTL